MIKNTRGLFKSTIWERGFRPFFLSGAIYALLSILLWVMQLEGNALFSTPFDDPVVWHAHEMIFGFTLAIVAGFLLTAVAKWTGGETASGGALAGLMLLWLLGRVAMNIGYMPYFFRAFADLAFIPALATSLAIPLFKSRNSHNFIFLGMLGALFLCNLHVWVYQDRTSLYVAIVMIMMMISAIGGRIIPSFTVAGLRVKGQKVFQTDQPRADLLALVSVAALALCVMALGMASPVTGGIAIVSAAVHIWRQRHYHTLRVWREPMLWSLHAGYMWMIAGLVLIGISSFGVVALPPALHALTAGAIGTLTLSMMCRVALGHTGRNIEAGRMTVLAFTVMQAVAFVRVFGPLLWPAKYMLWVEVSGVLWTVAFGLYVLVYAPILWGRQPERERSFTFQHGRSRSSRSQ